MFHLHLPHPLLPSFFPITAITCADLQDPKNGTVEIKANRVGGKAVYSCNDGYKLTGLSTRLCHANGKWTGVVPVCKGEDSAIM